MKIIFFIIPFLISCVSNNNENSEPTIQVGKYTALLNCSIGGASFQVRQELNLTAEYYTLSIYSDNQLTAQETGPWSQGEQQLCLNSECLTTRNIAVNKFELSLDDPEAVTACNTSWLIFIKE